MKISKIKLSILFGLSSAFLTLGIIVLGKIMLFSENQPSNTNISKIRPDIVDRNGILIATSGLTKSVYAHPKMIENPENYSKKIVKIFPSLKYDQVLEKLKSKKTFVWIVQNITNEEELAVLKEKMKYVDIRSDEKRFYPQKNLFSHVVGYIDYDQNGVIGIEKWIDKNEIDNEIIELSIDTKIQYFLRDEILNGIKEFDAKWGCGIVVDIHTGEILGMVSLNDFDPNNIENPSDFCMFNHITSGLYEFGSIIKIFSLGLYLKYNLKNRMYDVSEPIKIGSFMIKDHKPFNGSLDVFDGFLISSNICFAKAALDVGGENQKEFFKQIGLFDKIDLELFEVISPNLPVKWDKPRVITSSYGYGISTTPLNIMQSFLNVISPNKVKLTLIKSKLSKKEINDFEYIDEIVKILNETMKNWLGKSISDYSFGGKTGTANVLVNGKYVEKRNITSFLAVFPSESPKYAILIILGEPKPNQKTLGFAYSVWFTTPIARNIINLILKFVEG